VARIKREGTRQWRSILEKRGSPAIWAANLAATAAGGIKFPMAATVDRAEVVRMAFFSTRARIKGIPKIETAPKQEIPPNRGRLVAIPR
jgi:hypothetical protein